jgi:hypothetical protein
MRHQIGRRFAISSFCAPPLQTDVKSTEEAG